MFRNRFHHLIILFWAFALLAPCRMPVVTAESIPLFESIPLLEGIPLLDRHSLVAQGEQGRELQPGALIEREISGGQAHAYSVTLAAGQYLSLVAEQRGINVAVRLFSPDGKQLTEVDIEDGQMGQEPLSQIIHASGTYRLEVRAVAGQMVSGGYVMKLEELRAASPQDSSRDAAMRAFLDGKRLLKNGTAESIKNAHVRFTESLDLFQKAGDRHMEALALHGVGEAAFLAGEIRGALGLLNRALAIQQALRLRREEGITLGNIGSCHLYLGESRKALEYFHQALDILEAVGDSAGQANTLRRTGEAYYSLGEEQKALEFYNRALPLWRSMGDRLGEAQTLNALGGLYDAVDEKQKALDHYAQALPLLRATGDRRGEAKALNNIGLVYYFLGEFQKSLDYYAEALPLRRAVGDRRGESVTLYNIGVVYDVLGESQKALDYYAQALPLARAVGDRSGEAYALSAIGRVYDSLGDRQRALEHYERALRLNRDTEDRTGEAQVLNNIGVTHVALGETQKALDFYHQALQINRAIKERSGEAETLKNIGLAYAALGETQKALDHFSQALPLWRAANDPGGEAATLYAIARAERDRGNLAAARASIDAALGIIESLRARITYQELRTSYLATAHNCYELAVDLLMRLHQLEPTKGYAAAALETSERARARTLLEMLAEAGLNARQDLTPQQRERESHLFSRISAIQRELWKADLPPGRETQLKKELAAAEDDLQAFRLELRRTNPRYAGVHYPEPLKLDRLQREVLDSDTALVEYALGEERSFAWVVTRNHLTVAHLPPRKEIEELIAAYRQAVSERASALTLKQALARLEGQSQRLYRAIFQPLAGALSATRRLIIVPDGALAYLPFETLSGDSGLDVDPAPTADALSLLERFHISYAPSASALATIKENAAKQREWSKALIAFGDPVYDREGADAGERLAARTTKSEVLSLYAERGFEFNRLPYTREEVTSIGALFPAAKRQVYLGAAAGEQAVKAENLGQYRYVHFAAHGYIDEEKPTRSGIVLSLCNDAREDGVLQMSEVMGLRLNADLVTLSACRTGLGKLVKGEGIIGLTRSFFHAGARSVMVSLWNVNDLATSELMKAFYQNLNRGLAKDEALRQAKLTLMKGGQRVWRHPYYWASFVLVGERQ